MNQKKFLLSIYHILQRHFGHQNWWPGESVDEIIIGAILTQGVSWQNVEKAIVNLKRNQLCSLKAIYHAQSCEISSQIKPALYYNQKTVKLKNFAAFLMERHNGDFKLMFESENLRQELLSINGIGMETADSILLYAGAKPIFVIDAYTIRIFNRLLINKKEWNYRELQEYFMTDLTAETEFFRDYHAQLVMLAKFYCRKKNPVCSECPLLSLCQYAEFSLKTSEN